MQASYSDEQKSQLRLSESQDFQANLRNSVCDDVIMLFLVTINGGLPQD